MPGLRKLLKKETSPKSLVNYKLDIKLYYAVTNKQVTLRMCHRLTASRTTGDTNPTEAFPGQISSCQAISYPVLGQMKRLPTTWHPKRTRVAEGLATWRKK